MRAGDGWSLNPEIVQVNSFSSLLGRPGRDLEAPRIFPEVGVTAGGPAEPAVEMREPPEPEALWDEMTRLCTPGTPVRSLPYALVDKRLIQWVPGGPCSGGMGMSWSRHPPGTPTIIAGGCGSPQSCSDAGGGNGCAGGRCLDTGYYGRQRGGWPGAAGSGRGRSTRSGVGPAPHSHPDPSVVSPSPARASPCTSHPCTLGQAWQWVAGGGTAGGQLWSPAP